MSVKGMQYHKGRPYAVGGAVTKWEDVKPTTVAFEDLVLTADMVSVQEVLTDETKGDPYPHVVAWNGKLWLDAGHARVVRAVLQGYDGIEARVHEL